MLRVELAVENRFDRHLDGTVDDSSGESNTPFWLSEYVPVGNLADRLEGADIRTDSVVHTRFPEY